MRDKLIKTLIESRKRCADILCHECPYLDTDDNYCGCYMAADDILALGIIDKEKFIEYCKKCADVTEKLEDECLGTIGKGASFAGAFTAVPYFHQRTMMYRSEIPALVEQFETRAAENPPKEDAE